MDRESCFSDYQKEYFDYEISSFCGLFISTKIISEIGYPNKEFFIWFDDSEYSLRIIEKGKIRNVNRAFLNHKTIINTIKNKDVSWKEYYGLRNSLYTVKKHFNKKIFVNTLNEKKRKKILYLLKWMISYKKKYLNYYHLYRDAINDALSEKLGINDKYCPK